MTTFCWGPLLVNYLYRDLLFTYLFLLSSSSHHLSMLFGSPFILVPTVAFYTSSLCCASPGFAVSPRFSLFVRPRDLQSPRAFLFPLFERPKVCSPFALLFSVSLDVCSPSRDVLLVPLGSVIYRLKPIGRVTLTTFTHLCVPLFVVERFSSAPIPAWLLLMASASSMPSLNNCNTCFDFFSDRVELDNFFLLARSRADVRFIARLNVTPFFHGPAFLG